MTLTSVFEAATAYTPGAPPPIPLPRLTGVGTAVPAHSYTQEELLDELRITDPKIRGLFLNSAIERRHLTLPARNPDGTRPDETQGELLRKHLTSGLALGSQAVERCAASARVSLSDIRYLCCVTSTGFLTPGLSALLIKELGLSRHCARLDVVGMGCNAGLNALAATSAWTSSHPGEPALMVCIETCSAAYVNDGSLPTAVVNSLFGDGAAAAMVVSGPGPAATPTPSLVRFTSLLIPEAADAMRYEWSGEHNKFRFHLDPDIPYVIGAHAEQAVNTLLAGTGLRRSGITHWIVHTGGKKVIESLRINLRLTRHDLRHTTATLRNYGNLSSGSFLFTYQHLLAGDGIAPGDTAVLMTMGPGTTIETALARW